MLAKALKFFWQMADISKQFISNFVHIGSAEISYLPQLLKGYAL